MSLTPDAEKYNAPRHFGRDLIAWIEEGCPAPAEIEPLVKPGKRRTAARRLPTQEHR